MNRTEVKLVTLTIDENQLCMLDTLISTVRAEHRSEWASRTDYEELRQYVKSKIQEIL